MDVTLGDSVLSVKERIKEVYRLTRDAASMKLYHNRGLIFVNDIRHPILSHCGPNFLNGERNLPSVFELTLKEEED